MPAMRYKGFQIIYAEQNGKIHVQTANYCGIQCTYGQIFGSMQELKQHIDNGGWSVGKQNNS